MDNSLLIFFVWALIASGISCICENVEMVYNGNFSEPKIYNPWTILNYLPSGFGKWKTLPPTNGFEIWSQGAMNSPSTALGKPTGQSLEINGNNAWAQIIYEVNLPCLMSTSEADFSFEYWFRPDWVVNSFNVAVEQQSRKLFDYDYAPKSNWARVTGSLKVQGCQPIRLVFSCSAQESGGVHINDVSFKVSSCKDVEMVMGGEFEQTTITKTWQEVESLEGGMGIWTASSSAASTADFVLWKQGAIGIPADLSIEKPDMAIVKPTGQTLEINAKSTKAKVGYHFFMPFMLGTAETTLSFEYFYQASTIVNYYGFNIEQGEEVVATKAVHNEQGCYSKNPDSWQKITYAVTLQPAMPVHIYFIADTATKGGIHIDNVSVKISEKRTKTVSELESYTAPQLEMVDTYTQLQS